MNKDEILQVLKSNKELLKENYGVERIALFGSYAKGTENKDSDVDFFVDFNKPSYTFLSGLYEFLENKIPTKIEIIRNGPHISKRFLKNIEKDCIYA
jgi:predicted nucleotidyltransferase